MTEIPLIKARTEAKINDLDRFWYSMSMGFLIISLSIVSIVPMTMYFAHQFGGHVNLFRATMVLLTASIFGFFSYFFYHKAKRPR